MPITRILNFEILGFLFALVATLAWQMLIGRINLKGLLRRKDGSAQLSPERILLLLVALAVCAMYLAEEVHSISGNMPDVTNNWLYLFGGCSGIYLARKAWSMRNRSKGEL
jgi:hypothetical protein